MTKTNKNSLAGSLMLLVAAFIWGSAFVAQTTGAEHVGPLTFTCLRNILGSVVLLPVIFTLDSIKKKNGSYKKMNKADYKTLLGGGAVCGVVLCLASVFQQMGIDKGTEAGKAGFITALYILIVPIISIFLGSKIRRIIWPCVGVSVVALYLLCVKEDNSVRMSDIYVLICAFLYSIHILVIDRVSPKTDGVRLSAVQFAVVSIISIIPAMVIEGITFDSVKAALPSIAYAGIMSSGVAYTFQIIGQQRTEPTVASMIMSLESVFAVITSMIILNQVPTVKESIGCVLMFAAIIVAQLPEKKQLTKASQ